MAALRDQRVSVLRRPEHVPLDPLERAIREDHVGGRDIRPLEEDDPLGAVTGDLERDQLPAVDVERVHPLSQVCEQCLRTPVLRRDRLDGERRAAVVLV